MSDVPEIATGLAGTGFRRRFLLRVSLALHLSATNHGWRQNISRAPASAKLQCNHDHQQPDTIVRRRLTQATFSANFSRKVASHRFVSMKRTVLVGNRARASVFMFVCVCVCRGHPRCWVQTFARTDKQVSRMLNLTCQSTLVAFW